jgi:carbamoyl-phosphate synthase/aspartate carbamoyltransferase/dihydroorotase
MSAEYIRLPGLVDPHVHLREPGATHKEDFETGTMAAIAGGFTTVLDMPNNPEPTISPESLQRKITLAGNRVYCDIGFHFGATSKGVEYFEKIKDQVFGLKIYMNHTTGTLLMEDKKELNSVFAAWPREKPIIVHAEGETLVTAIALAKLNNRKLHVAHIATKEDVEMVREAKEEGMAITCEVTLHHLFFTEADAQALGPFGVMKPTLKTEMDRLALWENLKLGVIDMIATDHAPHTREEKLSEKPPFGVPGLETSLPLLLTAVAEDKLTLDQVVNLTSTNPKKIFGIRGLAETFTEVDLKESYVIDAKNLKTKCAWTPFEGKRVTGRISRVVLRGRTVYDGEKAIGEPMGNIVFPCPI